MRSRAGGFGGRELFIRVNGVDTPWHAEDLSAAAHAAPDAILVPKVSSADTLELIGRRLLDMGTDHKTRVWAMIETPLAIFNILSIAAAARRFRDALVRPRDGNQRSRQGYAGASGAGASADAAMAIHVCRRGPHSRNRYPRWRLQRHWQCRRVYQGMFARRRARLRRQDAHSSKSDRAVQQGVFTFAGRCRAGTQDDCRLRPAGKQGQGRGIDRRSHGRAFARRYGAGERSRSQRQSQSAARPTGARRRLSARSFRSCSAFAWSARYRRGR